MEQFEQNHLQNIGDISAKIAGMDEQISMLLAQDLAIMDDAVIVRMFSCFLPDGVHWDENEWISFSEAYSHAFKI